MPQGEPTVILLAEDSPDVREMYRLAFELSSFRVIEAGDGLQAVQLTRTHRPDAIVMDLAMPRMDGWEACRKLRADPATRRIPILAVSAQGSADAQARALEAGCDEFLAKPVTPETLEDCVRRLLERPRPTDV